MGDVILTAGKLVAGTILTAAGAGNWGIPLILGGGAEVLGKVAGALLSKQPLSTVNVARGIEGNLPSLLNSVPIVYGERRVGLQLCDVIQQGTNNEELYLVGAVCRGSRNGGDIGGFRELYIDDRLAIDANGTVQSAFTGKLQRWTRGGSESQNPSGDSVLMGLRGSTYTALDRGLGVAYVIVRLVYDPTVYPNGVPQVTQVVRGEVCFDPRDSTWKWTANPALHLLDRLKRHGVPDDELDLSSFSTEANYFDETVTRPDASTGPRSSCNIVLDAEESCDVHLDRLRATCRAHLIFQGGVFRCSTRRVKSPASLILTQDLFAGADWTIGDAGVTQTPNLITYSWVDPARQWAARPGQWPAAGATNSFLTADQGIPAIVSLDLGGVTDGYQAEQLAMIALREGRLGLRCSATFQEPALQLVPDDLVRVTHDAAGWTQKLFWVDSVALQLDGCVRLELTEYDANAYSLDAQAVPASPPGTQLPDPLSCVAPSGLTLTPRTVAGVPQVLATWTASTDPFLDRYELQASTDGGTTWDTHGPTLRGDTRYEVKPVLGGGTVQVRLRAVNRIGVPSAWVTPAAGAATTQVPDRQGGVDIAITSNIPSSGDVTAALQAEINAAAAAEYYREVFLRYRQNGYIVSTLTIPPLVELRGETSRRTRLVQLGGVADYTPLLVLTSNDTNYAGFQRVTSLCLDGNRASNTTNANGQLLKIVGVQQARLRDLDLLDAPGHALWCEASASGYPTQVLRASSLWIWNARKRGVYLSSGAWDTFLTDFEVGGCGDQGIYLDYAIATRLVGVASFWNGNAGLAIYGGREISGTEIRFERNAGPGLLINGSRDIHLSRLRAYRNSAYDQVGSGGGTYPGIQLEGDCRYVRLEGHSGDPTDNNPTGWPAGGTQTYGIREVTGFTGTNCHYDLSFGVNISGTAQLVSGGGYLLERQQGQARHRLPTGTAQIIAGPSGDVLSISAAGDVQVLTESATALTRRAAGAQRPVAGVIVSTNAPSGSAPDGTLWFQIV